MSVLRVWPSSGTAHIRRLRSGLLSATATIRHNSAEASSDGSIVGPMSGVPMGCGALPPAYLTGPCTRSHQKVKLLLDTMHWRLTVPISGETISISHDVGPLPRSA